MKNLILLTSLTLVAFVFTLNAQSNPKDTSQYWQMAEKIKNGDLDIDYSQLRKAYSEWINKTKETEAPNRAAMVKAFESEDYAKATQLGETVILYELTNSGLLRAIAEAYSKSGNETKAKFYTELAHKVRHSLFLSGDGKSAKTAFYVVSIPEEYRVMRELGYTVSMQALQHVDGQAFDVLSGKDEKGNNVKVYFNICIFFGC